ncbi:hypothetical protein R3W88_013907 [Solanum pinnatisectum]|uniref:Uncharacterized protein n=1 Tax=Solanum pinnatisectum TaxID=50273 RepID=A0AAV9KQ76_9SOLN|nr:hypothetical protein R3W88_013907 [Solanum pinnatisectum]
MSFSTGPYERLFVQFLSLPEKEIHKLLGRIGSIPPQGTTPRKNLLKEKKTDRHLVSLKTDS